MNLCDELQKRVLSIKHTIELCFEMIKDEIDMIESTLEEPFQEEYKVTAINMFYDMAETFGENLGGQIDMPIEEGHMDDLSEDNDDQAKMLEEEKYRQRIFDEIEETKKNKPFSPPARSKR